jgi:hypothetical protein
MLVIKRGVMTNEKGYMESGKNLFVSHVVIKNPFIFVACKSVVYIPQML